MNRRHAHVIAVSVVMTTALIVPSPAGGQVGARLDLVAQTTYVGADPAVIDVRALGAPAEATISAQVHEAVTTRAGLVSSIAGRPRTEVIGEWTVEDLDAARVGAGDVISIQVPDEEVGELLRRPTDAGPHPVVIELVAGNRVLDTLVTHLLVVPGGEDSSSGSRLIVALTLDLAVPMSVTPDGTSSLDDDALDRAVDLASTLAARVELPLTVRLPPETFESLAAAGPQASLDRLRTASVGNSVLLSPWVDLDEEAWRRAGRSDLVVALYDAGREALDTTAGVKSGNVVVLDSTATSSTLSMLASEQIGATGFLLDADGVVGVPDGLAGPVVVIDDEGSSHPAALPDGLLEDLAVGPDPELAVQHTLSELLRMALNVDDSAGVVVVIDDIDLVALDLLLDGLDQPSPLIPGTVDDILRLPSAEFGSADPVEAGMAPTPPEDLSRHVTTRAELEHRLAAYESLVSGNESLIEPLRLAMLASVAESAAGGRDRYLEFVSQRVDAGLGDVELIDSGRITITSREADLPIVIHNGQTLPITAILALSAEKIDFPAGERQLIVLEPGPNEISVEVVALASGDSSINVTIESPNGGLELDSGVVRLRSTAISGLGLLISVIALAVLVGWWIQTVRQRRRSRRTDPDSVAGAAEPKPDRLASRSAAGETS